jgi:hypothetical protein
MDITVEYGSDAIMGAVEQNERAVASLLLYSRIQRCSHKRQGARPRLASTSIQIFEQSLNGKNVKRQAHKKYRALDCEQQ